MFGRVPFANPYEQIFGGYPVHQLQQQYPFGVSPQQLGLMGVASPWQAQQVPGLGPIGPLMPQQPIGVPQMGFGQQLFPPNPFEQIQGIGGQFGIPTPQVPFGYGQQNINPLALMALYGGGLQQGIPGVPSGFQQYPQQQFMQYPQQQFMQHPLQHLSQQFPQQQLQRDPRAELLSSSIAQITQTRDPKVEYLAQVVTHPIVASNPVLKDLVAKELLTAALQQVTFKSAVSPESQQGQSFFGGATLGQGIDPYTAAAIKSQVLAELANTQVSQLLKGGGQNVPSWGARTNPQFSSGMSTVI